MNADHATSIVATCSRDRLARTVRARSDVTASWFVSKREAAAAEGRPPSGDKEVECL
jgi:hypothetical protein